MLGWLTRTVGGGSAKYLFDSNFEKVIQRPLSEQSIIASMITLELDEQAELLTGSRTLQYVSAQEKLIYKESMDCLTQNRLDFYAWLKEESLRENSPSRNMYANLMFALYTAVRGGSDEAIRHILTRIASWKNALS